MKVVATIAAHLRVAFTLALVVPAVAAQGQLSAFAQDSETSKVDSTVSAASPRASVQQFMHLAGIGDWDAASKYLVIPASHRGRAEELTRKLHMLLEQRAMLNMRSISPQAVGDTSDGEPGADQIGVITVRNSEIPLRMVRTVNQVPPRWHFSGITVSRIDDMVDGIGAPWLRKYIPDSLMHEGPLHVFLWQWIGLAVGLSLLLVASFTLGFLLRSVLSRLVSHTATDWDDQLLHNMRGPFRLWLTALGIPPIVTVLDINVRVGSFLNATSRGLVLLAIFWAVLRMIRLMQQRMESAAYAHGQVQARTLIPLLGNILRVTLVVVALLVLLSQFGYPVGTILTGLGIGGIAVALAAQKTVEHLFGSISIAADRAFRIGDWVRAGTTEGTVERIGLRSTSFRTNERTVVRVPNGRLADERIETFGERDRMLLRADLDLTYETTPGQLETVCREIEALLRAHNKVWSDAVRVHVVAFTESAIRVNVICWFKTTNLDEFLAIRHVLYLEFMRIVERNRSGFAFPTRTVHVITEPAVAAVSQNDAPKQEEKESERD